MNLRILIAKSDAARLGGQLNTSSCTLIECDADGLFTCDGVAVTPHAAQPVIGWASAEILGTAAVRNFMIALLKSSALKWVQSASAGVDHPVFSTLMRAGARLSISHAQAPAIADFVVWSVLDHFQRGTTRRRLQAACAWEKVAFREVEGSTWLIVGFGAIGQAVAHRVKGFGGRVVAARREAGPHASADEVVALSDLAAATAKADVVVLALPLVPATRGMFNASLLGQLRTASVLVNVGRGELLDEDALAAALDRGAPEHAILDVFGQEPLPSSSALWTRRDVRVSAHCAGLGSGRQGRDDTLFLSNLERFAGGEPLDGEVRMTEQQTIDPVENP